MPRLPRKRARHPCRPSATPKPNEQRLPPKNSASVTKRHACHTEVALISPYATPAMPTKRATRASSAPQVPRSPHQKQRECHQVPRLLHKSDTDFTNRHACHACQTKAA